MSYSDSSHVHALRRRRRFRQLLGAVVCFLVIVGISSLISAAGDLIAKAFDDTQEREAIAARITTLVALDPVPFDSLSNANQSTLLNAAIWASINPQINYERDETGAMYLPTLDIDTTAAALYGPDFKFTYESFEDHGMQFTYVPEKQAYLLPITSAISDYSPLVTAIKREKGDVKRVTVGYVSPFNTSGAFNPNAAPEPVKYQDYLFRKNGSDYYLFSIAESQAKAPPAANGSSSPASTPPDLMQDPLAPLPNPLGSAPALPDVPAAEPEEAPEQPSEQPPEQPPEA